MQVKERLKNITSSWFYAEPVLFSISCSHVLSENTGMNIPMRSGALRIEYNPELLSKMEDSEIEEYLKVEMYRILLQHPYKRLPHNVRKNILILASDVIIGTNCKITVPLSGIEYLKAMSHRFKTLINPLGEKWAGTDEEKFFLRNLNTNRVTGAFEPVDDLSFEEWYRWIYFLISEVSLDGNNAGSSKIPELKDFSGEASELWEENQEALSKIQENVQNAEIDQGWGSMGGLLQRCVKESADFSMDYRRMLSQFRQSIVTASRTLTRMKPSRRFGFSAMGSRYNRKADILIAVDVSGSITDDAFNRFFRAIKNIFFLGIIENIDLIFFDTNLKLSKPVPFRKKIELKEIQGRGGTNFQCALDFFESSSKYNGMIIFTDGQGTMPVQKGSRNILWILQSRLDYEKCRGWINTLKGNKATYMPL